LIEGPRVESDALALVRRADDSFALIGAFTGTAGLSMATVGTNGRIASPVALSLRAPDAAQPASTTDATTPTTTLSDARPSSVPPPARPDAMQIARAPVQLVAAGDGNALSLLALSPTYTRAVLLRRSSASDPLALTQIAPSTDHTWEIGVATDLQNSAPLLFSRNGTAFGGPLVLLDPASASAHVAQTARARFTDEYASFGPQSERADAASNTHLPSMAMYLRRVRSHWSDTCSPLLGRARALVRAGVPDELLTIVRQRCELPPDPTTLHFPVQSNE
jgi:hypothetical protein